VKPFKTVGTPMHLLADDLRKVHVTTQLLRFGRLFAMFFFAHLAFPGSWNWQALAALIAASAEAAIQQMAPQLPLLQVLRAVITSPALRRYLAQLDDPGTAGAPQTRDPLTAPPRAWTQARTAQTSAADPASDPAQKSRAIPPDPE
jgi:hypothetical protein